jgi:hypothetical protein
VEAVHGKIAVITGDARGQGRSHAVRLAQEGVDIIAVDLCAQPETVSVPGATPEDLEETARQVEALDRRIVTAIVDWAPIAVCGRCYSCSVLEQTPCENSQFFEHAERPNCASYPEYAWLPRGLAFYRLPDKAQPDAVAARGCALPTVLRGFEQAGHIQADETVVVQGAGPVGLAAVCLGSVAGAREIVMIDRVAQRLEVARRLEATATLSLTELTAEQRRQQVFDIVGPNGRSVVVEAAGALPGVPRRRGTHEQPRPLHHPRLVGADRHVDHLAARLRHQEHDGEGCDAPEAQALLRRDASRRAVAGPLRGSGPDHPSLRGPRRRRRTPGRRVGDRHQGGRRPDSLNVEGPQRMT